MDEQWLDWMAPEVGYLEVKSENKWVALGVALVFALLLAGYGLFIDIRVDPIQVEKIVLHGPHGCGCQPESGETVELSADEMWKFMRLYNCSTYAGEINADGCETSFSADIYLRNGCCIYLWEFNDEKLYLSPTKSERYWVCDSKLHDYIVELVDKYELHTD